MANQTDLGRGDQLAAALARLASTIDDHSGRDVDISYTAKLLSGGPMRCGKKLGEEGVECALAVAAQGEGEVVEEAADLLYHLLVALKSRSVTLDSVGVALTAREGRSGLEEKAARPKD